MQGGSIMKTRTVWCWRWWKAASDVHLIHLIRYLLHAASGRDGWIRGRRLAHWRLTHRRLTHRRSTRGRGGRRHRRHPRHRRRGHRRRCLVGRRKRRHAGHAGRGHSVGRRRLLAVWLTLGRETSVYWMMEKESYQTCAVLWRYHARDHEGWD